MTHLLPVSKSSRLCTTMEPKLRLWRSQLLQHECACISVCQKGHQILQTTLVICRPCDVLTDGHLGELRAMLVHCSRQLIAAKDPLAICQSSLSLAACDLNGNGKPVADWICGLCVAGLYLLQLPLVSHDWPPGDIWLGISQNDNARVLHQAADRDHVRCCNGMD